MDADAHGIADPTATLLEGGPPLLAAHFPQCGILRRITGCRANGSSGTLRDAGIFDAKRRPEKVSLAMRIDTSAS